MNEVSTNEKFMTTAELAEALGVSNDTVQNSVKKLGENFRRVLNSENIPYQKYIDAGYFRVIESKYTTPTGETLINLKTVVYQKGVAYINKLSKEVM